MELNDILNLPKTKSSINLLLEFLKNSDNKERYIINVIILEIYYHYQDERFLNYYHMLDQESPLDDEYFQKFLHIKTSYLIDNEKYDEAYQSASIMKNNHYLLGRIYFELNRYIDAKREFLMLDEMVIELAYIYLAEKNFNDALNIASHFSGMHYEYILSLKRYEDGGKLEFFDDPPALIKIRMAIDKMKILSKGRANNLAQEILPIIDEAYPGLRYLFYKQYYLVIGPNQNQEQIHLEIERLYTLLNIPLIYRGEDENTIIRLNKLYQAFNDFEDLLIKLNQIDFKLAFREIYRLSLIELNKLVPFSQAIILFDYESHASIIDFKKGLAYDKDKPIELILNTPFDQLLIDGRERIINDYDQIKRLKDIATGKYLLDMDVLMVLSFPIIRDEKTIGGIVFYAKEMNLFSDYNYEMIHLFVRFFLAKIQMKDSLNKDVANYASYKYLFDNIDLAIKYIYNDETHFNTFGTKLNEEIKLLDFYEKSLTYQESLYQITNNIIDSFDFDFVIKNRYYHESMKKIVFGDVILYVSIIRENTVERQELNYQTKLATQSFVANLPNRRALEADLLDYLNDKFTLFIIDINRFKMFNEVYGYESGDIVLKAMGREIKLISEEYSCYHLDGDRFVILYRYVNDQRAIKKEAQKIIETLENLLYQENYRFKFTFTVSSLRYPVHTEDKKPRKLLKLLTNALTNAKDGIGLVSRYQDYNRDDYKDDCFEQILMTQVSEAMDERRLVINYHQVVDVKTNKVNFYEARLNIQGFNVSAKIINEIAVKRNLILELDKYLIRNTINELRRLGLEAHRYIKVSIKVNVKTFMWDDFVPFLKSEILGASLKPDLFTIEIDEKIYDYELTNYKIQELRNFRIKVIIHEVSDIFRIQADYIKLHDGSSYLNREQSLILLKNIEALVNTMDMNLIMADVNTLDEASLIKGLGLRYVLGNCYKKRSTIEDIMKKMGDSFGRSIKEN